MKYYRPIVHEDNPMDGLNTVSQEHVAKAVAISQVDGRSVHDILHAAGFGDQLNHSPWPKAALNMANALLTKPLLPKPPPFCPKTKIKLACKLSIILLKLHPQALEFNLSMCLRRLQVLQPKKRRRLSIRICLRCILLHACLKAP